MRFLPLLLAGGLLALTGCRHPAGEKAPGAGDDRTITVLRNVGGREGFRQHWELWKKTFEAANPGWKMELIDLGDNDAPAYFKTHIATDDLPDVMQMFGTTRFLADGGQIQPIPESFYEKFGIDVPTPYHGKYYTTQTGLQINGIAVNRKMWADIGITEPPRTWDAFIDGLRKLKAKGYQPLAYGGREWSACAPLQYALEMDLYDHDLAHRSWTLRRDAGEVSFATDPAARVIMEKLVAFLDEFTSKGVLSDGYADEGREFYSGQAATWMMGCWIGGELEPNQVNLDVAYWPVPSMTGKPPAFIADPRFQNGWTINSHVSGERLEKCMAVEEALFAPAVYQRFLDAEVQFPQASKVAVTRPRSDWPPAQRLFDDMKANLDKYGLAPGWNRAMDDQPPRAFNMTRVMQAILCGEKDPDRLVRMLDNEWYRARKGE